MINTMKATSRRPAASWAASVTPMPSSSEASRIVENISEAPKKTTIVQSSVFRSTGGHDSRAPSAPAAAPASAPLVSERVNDRPVLAGALGALVIAFSAILVRLAEVSPSTAAFFRCAYAVPLLGLLAWIERRRYGPRPLRERMITLGTGALFAADLVLWHYSIQAVGAGLATVLGNVQVVLVALLAWAFLSERPSNRTLASIPVVFVGVVLISGVVGAGAYGDDPLLGVVYGVATAIAYSLFILVLRHANADLRRPAGPLFDATLSAAIFCALAGVLIGDIDWAPDLEAQGWLVLLALSSQVLGWLLISVSLPRLPAALTSILLMLQPVCTVFLGALLLSEEPSAVQLSGVAIVLAGVGFATIQPRKRELEPA
jgi:drug/metabolite transporter (DMT)-like permease